MSRERRASVAGGGPWTSASAAAVVGRCMLACGVWSALAVAASAQIRLHLPERAREDFEQGNSGWRFTDAAAWRLENAGGSTVLHQFQRSRYKPPHRSPYNIALWKSHDVTDFVLTARVRSTTRDYPHRDVCLFFGYQDPAHFYYVHFGKRADDHANQIFIVNGKARTKISEKSTKGTPWNDDWHTVRVVRRVGDGTIEVYFDDMNHPVMVAHDQTFDHGLVGIGSFDDTAQWDDIVLQAAGASPAKSGRRRLPNIVYIMADDLGYAELGCYGQQKIKTPNIDRLAAQGMRFTQHYTSAPVCAPARCSLMTGRHGGHAIVRDNFEVRPSVFGDAFGGQYPLPDDAVTIAELLKERGYATGAFGKWGLGGVGTTGDPLKQGFDRFFGFNCQRHAHNLYPRYLVDNDRRRPLPGNTRGITGDTYGPQAIADEMLKFIRRHKDEPFFVYYPSVLPHLALQAPQDEVAQYEGQWPETPYKGRSYLPNATPRATYAAMISFLDKQVGRLTALLNELGLADDTVIFFTSDNGTTMLKGQVDYEFFQSVGPLRGLKGSVYEGGIRIPLIVRWPGKIRPGSQTDLISAHYDAMATLCEIAGIPVPRETDGVSYLPTLLGRDGRQRKHEFLFWDFAGYGGQLAVRLGRWKGVRRNLKRNPDAPLELYDLESDISEQHNVVEDHPGIAEKIRRIMVQERVPPAEKRFRFGEYR